MDLERDISYRWRTQTDIGHRLADTLEAVGWRVETEPRLGRLRPDVVAEDKNGRSYVIEIKVGRAGSHFGAVAQAAQQARVAQDLEHLERVVPVLLVVDADAGLVEEAAHELGVALLTVETETVSDDLRKLPLALEENARRVAEQS